MTEKTLQVIQSAINHTMHTIEALACEDYPHTPFEDKEIGELYYELVYRSVVIGEKIKESGQDE